MTGHPSPDQIRATSRALAWIRSYDANFPRADEAMTLAWARAFAHHDLSATDLEAGVDAHFADVTRPRDRVLPADIIRPARESRRQRAERERAVGTTDRQALTARRRAIDECTLCDPNGWIDTDAGLTRCAHNARTIGAA